MDSIFERTSAGTIYKAPKHREFPKLDLLTLLFDSDVSDAKEDTTVHADAADPNSKRITKSELHRLVKRLAHTLRYQYGIGKSGPGKDVALAIVTGHFLVPTLFFSTIAAGGVYSSSNPSSTPKELLYQLNLVKPKLLFCNEDTKSTAIAAANLFSLPLSRVLCLDTSPKSTTLRLVTLLRPQESLMISSSELDWPTVPEASLPETTIVILFSSGTTGPPKACMLSHTNLVSEICLTVDPTREYYSSRPTASFSYRAVAHLPTAHIAGLLFNITIPFYLGGTVYWMKSFDFPLFLKYSKQYRMTHLFTVPPVYLAISKSPLVTDQLDHVEQAVCGGAPMGKELQIAVRKKIGGGTGFVTQTWGMSELAGCVTVMPMGDPKAGDETGSVSMLISGAEFRIVDDEEKDVEVGQPGEILVKGPMVTRGYWGNEEANRQAFDKNGWFRTGDIGLFRDGLFYIVDRKKELIKYKGNQVAPAELEALLINHPHILDAAVIGVERDHTEVPRAYIVGDPKQVGAGEIADWVAGQVSSYKRLRGGVVFVPAIPKSPSGKILRKELRTLAKSEDREMSGYENGKWPRQTWKPEILPKTRQ
ncbi:putative acyl-coenzyme A synthetase [Cladorrhinum sp. PSN259]|nr:putative acyl-coenzyme A synthetase [Cladorrhinum sp. PSN259]